MFMHHFLLHLGVNLIALYFVGNNIERNKWFALTLVIFIITGILGVFISKIIVSIDSIIAGTSISIFGLIGASLAICLTEKNISSLLQRKLNSN